MTTKIRTTFEETTTTEILSSVEESTTLTLKITTPGKFLFMLPKLNQISLIDNIQ